MNDPIAIANKQNCWTVDYQQINALYKYFVPLKELSAKQKYFPSSIIPSDKTLNATASIPASMPRLGYNTQVLTCSMFDCDDYFTSESDDSLPPSPIYDRYQSGDGYHVVPPPYTGTFMPPKPDLVFHNASDINETVHTAFNIEVSPTKPENDLSHTHRPSALIIEEWVFDLKDESKTKIPHIIPSS
nr:hypothetical protein [Tanacetum cinerariifolium]